MAYRSTLQADALKLVAKKLQSSLAVEGELMEDGLAAYGDDLFLVLARKIVSGEEDADSVNSVFAREREAEASTESTSWTTGGSLSRSSLWSSKSTAAVTQPAASVATPVSRMKGGSRHSPRRISCPRSP